MIKKNISILLLFGLLFFLISSVSAIEDNGLISDNISSSEIMLDNYNSDLNLESDNNLDLSDGLVSDSDLDLSDGLVSDSKLNNNLTSYADSNSKGYQEKAQLKSNSLTDKGKYINSSDAYKYLNAFRTEKNVWYWNEDNENKTYFNANDSIYLKPLKRDADLENTAKIRAKQISEYFSHYLSNGSICFDIFPEGLLDYGENIASYYPTAYEVTEGWKETNESYDDQGHRRSMLEPGFNCVGIAGYKVGDIIYWVQDFGLKYDPEDTSAKFHCSNNTFHPDFSIELPIYASGNFSLKINGNEIVSKPIFHGKANLTLYGLIAGTYDVELSYSGDFNYKPVNKTLRISVPEGEILAETLPFSYLNTLLQLAEGEVKLERNYAYDKSIDSNLNGGILISKSLTIDGQRHSIDGRGLSRILRINASDVNISNLDFINGNAISDNGKGGAIYGSQTFSIINSTFINNSASTEGGAIFLSDDAHLENCIFINNSAKTNGGAVYSNWGFYPRNSTFIDNHADDLGGAIYSSIAKAYDCLFRGNANVQVFSRWGFSNSNSTIVNDEYSNLFINATMNNGIVRLGKNLNASQTILINASNVTIDGNGYAIDAQKKFRIFYITGRNVTIKNIRLLNGYSKYYGGAINSQNGNLSIVNSSINGNIAEKGGGIYIEDGSLFVIGSTIANNELVDFSGEGWRSATGGGVSTSYGDLFVLNSSFINNTAYNGGAIHTEHGETFINDSTFRNNDATYYAGGVIHTDSDIHISNSTFLDNDAIRYGGVIFNYDDSRIFISDSVFRNNTSNHYGGVISAARDLEISNSIFEDNQAKPEEEVVSSDEGRTIISSSNGGVIASWGKILINNSSFINNSADDGGVIFNYANENNVSIVSSSFINNHARSSFGVMDITTNAFIANSSFINNSAINGTAGAIGSYQYLSVSNSSFINNSAIDSSSSSTGGAIRNFGLDLFVENSSFINNSADEGGSIYNPSYSNFSAIDSRFIGNVAKDGGAIKNVDEYYYDEKPKNTKRSILNSEFINNSAQNGGAIYNGNGTLDIGNSSFIDNNAKDGGSIKDSKGAVFVSNSSFKSNPLKNTLSGNVKINGSKVIEANEDLTFYYALLVRTSTKILYSDMSTGPVAKSDGRIGNYFCVKLLDEKNNPLAGLPIKIGFNGRIYNRTTDSSGGAKLQINLAKEDIYTFAICFLGDDEYNASFEVAKIDVSKKYPKPNKANETTGAQPANRTQKNTRFATSILYSDMVTESVLKTDGRVGKYFTVKLVDNKKKAMANVPIKIGFNGRIYNRTTDSNGGAKLQINLLKPTTYTFAIAYLGDSKYQASFEVAKIKVNKQTPKLTASAKTFKSNLKTKAVSATLKSANGKAISGKKIKFTINGKTYSATTNANGIASAKISLSKKGKYIATANFAGDANTKATSVKFTLKIV